MTGIKKVAEYLMVVAKFILSGVALAEGTKKIMGR